MAGKILVVDDDANIAELLELYLEKEGFDVIIASDGGSGVKAFEEKSPDLVLLDVMMPVLDGWGVLKEIRSKSKIPVIMLTAKPIPGKRPSCPAAPIRKPLCCKSRSLICARICWAFPMPGAVPHPGALTAPALFSTSTGRWVTP